MFRTSSNLQIHLNNLRTCSEVTLISHRVKNHSNKKIQRPTFSSAVELISNKSCENGLRIKTKKIRKIESKELILQNIGKFLNKNQHLPILKLNNVFNKMAQHIYNIVSLLPTTSITSKLIMPYVLTRKLILSLSQNQLTPVNRNFSTLLRNTEWQSNLVNHAQLLRGNNKQSKNTSNSVILNVTINIPNIKNIHNIHKQEGFACSAFIENIPRRISEKENSMNNTLFNKFSTTIVRSRESINFIQSSSKDYSHRIKKYNVKADVRRMYITKHHFVSSDNVIFKFLKLVKRNQETVKSMRLRNLHKKSKSNTTRIIDKDPGLLNKQQTRISFKPHLADSKKSNNINKQSTSVIIKQTVELNKITTKTNNTKTVGKEIGGNNKIGTVTLTKLKNFKKKYQILKIESLSNQIKKFANDISLSKQEEATIVNFGRSKLQQSAINNKCRYLTKAYSNFNSLKPLNKPLKKNVAQKVSTPNRNNIEKQNPNPREKQENIKEKTTKQSSNQQGFKINQNSNLLDSKRLGDGTDCKGLTRLSKCDRLRLCVIPKPTNKVNYTMKKKPVKPTVFTTNNSISKKKRKLHNLHSTDFEKYLENHFQIMKYTFCESLKINTSATFRTPTRKHFKTIDNKPVNHLTPQKIAMTDNIEGNKMRKGSLLKILFPFSITPDKVMISMTTGVDKPKLEITNKETQTKVEETKQYSKQIVIQPKENPIMIKINNEKSGVTMKEKLEGPTKIQHQLKLKTIDQPNTFSDENMTTEKLIEMKTTELCKILLELMKLFSKSALQDIERAKYNKFPGNRTDPEISDGALTNQSLSCNKETKQLT